MAEYSHKRFIVSLNSFETSITVDEWDNSADSFSFGKTGESLSLTEAFGNHVFIDSGSNSHTLQIKLMQHGKNQRDLRKLQAMQSKDISSVSINLFAKDPINGDEMIATGGKIQTPATSARGNAHNSNTWVILFPNGSIKEST